jgi:hypothetical protein
VPANGSVTACIVTIRANTGSLMAAAVTSSMSAAVDFDAAANPLASAKWVARMPSALATAFIFATNVLTEPASQTASA